MTNWIKNNVWCLYLGGIVSVTGINITNWEWWVICIPTVALVTIYKKND